MEVDDAIVMAEPLQDTATVLDKEKSGEHPTKDSVTKVKHSKTTDNEDEPPGQTDPMNDSVLTATPFKLEVSGSEDEEDDAEEPSPRSGIRRKLILNPTEDESEANDGLDEIDEISKKRKRYEVRRSGSEECLLGFDEQSGEAELVKAEDAEEKQIESEEASKPLETPEELCASPRNSPKPLNKGIKQKIGSPATPSPRSNSKSPKVKHKSPAMESPTTRAIEKSPSKTHIVGDGEETDVAKPISDLHVKKVLSPQDEFYKKPFEFGWKRELVWRANPEASKDKADVYFISPAGKKLRARTEIIPLLERELTIEHFCFVREPLGAAPEFEIVRSAKPSSRASVTAATLAAAPSPPNIGKRVSKPKGPKGASPPPQGWTPSKALKVNNAALLSSTNSVKHSTGHLVNTPTTPNSRKQDNNHGPNQSSKSLKAKRSASSSNTSKPPDHHIDLKSNVLNTKEQCTINCMKAQGLIPQLQCTRCFCYYHHECYGLNANTLIGKEFVCEACVSKAGAKSSGDNAVTTTASPSSLLAAKKPNSHQNSKVIRPDNKFQQTIAVVKGKKYVMVSKSLPLPNEHVNDIENDLKQINDSIRKNRKSSINSLDGGAFQANSQNLAVVDNSNKLFATNFFANVSYAYDSLLCILKYLKIHERPRAASVCKLWNLAAKDTSLWQVVRMKNSKVCSWSGFAGALRRGETKHLDLRKMLLPSGRSEDVWNDFCENIGTVFSLETIDLCRCSARVVESLFQSNRNLRILNALAINDDTINLEYLALLISLEELRLRTCEAGVLSGDLTPLSSLTKLKHLSLTSIKGLGEKSVQILGELTGLKSLELGECGDFDSKLAVEVLPKLINLQRLRLENGQVTSVCTLEILDAVARLEQLNQLELVNFDIKPEFDDKLSLCTNISKLLIIPTYISQSATTNQIVLSAVQQVSETLKVFTWCVTVELLRVTALYVDQCEESTKKEKHHFDECIPVLKPVPGAPPSEDEENMESSNLTDDDKNAEVPQIEILPLDKVETILAENLPHTKFTIVKVPYHATSKQQLVE